MKKQARSKRKWNEGSALERQADEAQTAMKEESKNKAKAAREKGKRNTTNKAQCARKRINKENSKRNERSAREKPDKC